MLDHRDTRGLADAAKTPGDGRSMDQRRFDVLTDLALDRLDSGDLPARGRRRPHLQVTVGYGTLLGLDQEPGELAGYGPITAATARTIAGDATWTRLLTDPASGVVLDYGTTVYQVPAGLRDHVNARDKTCRHPGCRQPAHRCELDHTIEFPHGATAAANLHPLCKHHHRLKHHTDWTVAADGQGGVKGQGLTWTDPNGHSYHVPAEPALGDPPPPAPAPATTTPATTRPATTTPAKKTPATTTPATTTTTAPEVENIPF